MQNDSLTPKQKAELDYSLYTVDSIVCGCCGTVMLVKKSGTLFDIFDSSWTCKECKSIWYSHDGWEEQDNYLISFRGGAWFER